MIGKSVLESNLKRDFGVTVIGIKQRGEKMKINPGPQTLINPGDVLVLLGHTRDLEGLSQTLKK